MSDVDEESVSDYNTKKLKAALHYTIGKMSESVGESKNVTFNKEVIGVLAELTFKQIGRYSQNLELYSSHAKRTVIKPDDVKLLIRKTDDLCEYICKKEESWISDKVPTKKKGKPTSTKD